MIEIVEFFLLKIAMPLLVEISKRRDLDPTFKHISNEVFRDWTSAATSADRKQAAKKLYELQKS